MLVKKSLNQYIESGMSENDDVDCYNFYDWFCSDKSLKNRAKTLDTKLKYIIDSPRLNINKNTYTCYYKNNCPLVGKLYDYIGIRPLTGDGEFFVITPSSGHQSIEGKGDVWSSKSGIIFEGTWKEIKVWLKG